MLRYREMTSLLTTMKQLPLNSGYYTSISSISSTVYDLQTTSTDSAPLFVASALTSAANNGTALNAVGTVFRDEGKTLRSSGRVFRKVQLMTATGSVNNSSSGTDGVGGVAGVSPNTGFLTMYIELPGNPSSGTSSVTPVARLG